MSVDHVDRQWGSFTYTNRSTEITLIRKSVKIVWEEIKKCGNAMDSSEDNALWRDDSEDPFADLDSECEDDIDQRSSDPVTDSDGYEIDGAK